MKRVMIFLFLSLLVLPVFAVQKCVDFSGVESGAQIEYIVDMDSLDWKWVFPNLTIRGIGVCAATVGELGDVSDSLTMSLSGLLSGDYKTNNFYCWCRMLSPALSDWVAYGSESDDPEECVMRCADDCGIGFVYDPELKSAMLDSLSN